jgi:hypothetical protein
MNATGALRMAQEAGISVGIAGDFIRYQSHRRPPARVLYALTAAKPEIVALLSRFSLDASGGLIGDALLDTSRSRFPRPEIQRPGGPRGRDRSGPRSVHTAAASVRRKPDELRARAPGAEGNSRRSQLGRPRLSEPHYIDAGEQT